MQRRTIPYASHPTMKGMTELQADLFLPAGPEPSDLLVWMHSGGFRSGSRTHRNHTLLAEAFARHGIASAFIDYRLARPPAILKPGAEAMRAELEAEGAAAETDLHVTFYGHRPLAVVEDCCAFLTFAESHRADWNLTGRYLVGGSSSGAISALNVLFLPEVLGLARPPIATVLAYSAAFAYPSRIRPMGARILMQVGPADERVPGISAHRLADRLGALGGQEALLLEHADYEHGEPRLTPEEPFEAAIARAVAIHRGAPLPALPDGAIVKRSW